LDALDNGQNVVVDGKTARKSVELICAIYESSRRGMAVNL
jgi:predicted dehydrogenase